MRTDIRSDSRKALAYLLLKIVVFTAVFLFLTAALTSVRAQETPTVSDPDVTAVVTSAAPASSVSITTSIIPLSDGSVITTTNSSDPDGNSPPVNALETWKLLWATIQSTILAAFGTAPITTVVVSILKRIPALISVPAPTLTFVVAAILWIIAAVSEHFGVRAQFNSLLDLVTTIAPPLLAFIVTMVGAHHIYVAASNANVKLIGDSKSQIFGATAVTTAEPTTKS